MYSNKDSFTKIIATLGPASSSKEILRKMIYEGLDVCRLNFSHGTHKDHEKVIKTIKELNDELNTNVAILVDLQGPKLRIGEIENNKLVLKKDSLIHFVTDECIGNAKKIHMSYKLFPIDVMPGELVLVDDGKIKLEVIETNRKNSVSLKVINGGVISSHKGVNLPNTKVSLPSLTEKDLEDVAFALKFDIHWIALSFVRSANDIIGLRELIKKSGKEIKIIAKIEKPEAIESFDEIVSVTDGVMIARGDLGVETPFDKVPVLQKQLVRSCITKAKPVIIATQMMESMITNFMPTRAEATDVSNAVLDGADAVMLSGETSVGDYPIDVIINMQKVINATEASGFYLNHDYAPKNESNTYISDSICYNACNMANLIDAAGIVVFTFSGGTALKIASHRPNSNIFAFSSDDLTIKQLSLVRGVNGFLIDKKINIIQAIRQSIDTLKANGLINVGERLIYVVGIPMDKREPVNTIHISIVD